MAIDPERVNPHHGHIFVGSGSFDVAILDIGPDLAVSILINQPDDEVSAIRAMLPRGEWLALADHLSALIMQQITEE